jgi:hypothetical protein
VKAEAVEPVRAFQIIRYDDAPPMSLRWHSRHQRNRVLRQWRRTVFAAFGDQSRCIRVAWVLLDLFHAERGFAYPSDPYLANETGLPLNKLQAALTTLDRGGAIIRVHVVAKDGRTQRRIFPSRVLIPPEAGGIDTPQLMGGQNLNVRKTRQSLTQLDMARLDAMRRDRE